MIEQGPGVGGEEREDSESHFSRVLKQLVQENIPNLPPGGGLAAKWVSSLLSACYGALLLEHGVSEIRATWSRTRRGHSISQVSIYSVASVVWCFVASARHFSHIHKSPLTGGIAAKVVLCWQHGKVLYGSSTIQQRISRVLKQLVRRTFTHPPGSSQPSEYLLCFQHGKVYCSLGMTWVRLLK